MNLPRSILHMIGCAAVLLAPSEGLAVEATLTDDVSIDVSSAVRAHRIPHGAGPLLSVKGTSQRVGLQFDLATVLPPTFGGQFKANLRLFVSRVDRPGKIRVFIFRSGAAWNEDSAPASLATFKIPARGSTGTDSIPEAISAKPATRAKSFLDVDVTTLLQAAAVEPGPVTFLVVGDADTALTFDSKENMATSHPASLQISVVPNAPAQQDGEIPNPSVTIPIIIPTP